MKKISVTVKPNARQESVTEQADGSLLVKVNAPPVDGKANERLLELLAKHLKCSKSSLTLISGHKSRKKVFSIS